MGDRMHLLYGHGHDAPPVGAFTRQHHSPRQSQSIAGGACRIKKRVVQPNPLNPGESALSGWFREHFGSGGKRLRRIGIVAVARK
jgi:hypothetical protein